MNEVMYFLGRASFPLKMLLLVAVSVFPRRPQNQRFWFGKLFLFLGLTVFAGIYSNYLITNAAINYAMVFACCTATAYFCFEVSFWDALFCAASCYAMEHISACVSICWQVLTGSYLAELDGLGRFMSDAIIYGTLILLYLVFVRRFQKQWTFVPQSAAVGLLVMVVLVIALVLSVMQFRLGYMIEGKHDWVAFVTALLRMIACFLVLVIQSHLLNNTQLQTDNTVLQNMLTQEQKRYLASKESAELLNIRYHDMKHILTSLKAMESGDSNITELIGQIEDAVDGYSRVKKTGNEALDTVLFEKLLVCRKLDARLSYMGNGQALSFISPIDIYALVGNILDNAIEGIRQEDMDKRYIDLRIAVNGPYVKLCCENYCSRQILFSEGIPMPTKKNAADHGFGTKSIIYIAHKYGGEAFFEKTDSLFRVNIVFSGGQTAR